jgi:hypothetical protein
MKKLLPAVLIAAALTATSLVSVQAAERPTSVASCKKSTAKPRVPATIKQPMVPAKKIPQTLTLRTNCGTITATLLTKEAPQTTTNITTLANKKYFNKTVCHRLTTEGIFVLQCGDPTAEGSGALLVGLDMPTRIYLKQVLRITQQEHLQWQIAARVLVAKVQTAANFSLSMQIPNSALITQSLVGSHQG